MSCRLTLAIALALAPIAAAAQSDSVASLLKSGFTIAGVIPSSAGPGIFLVKGEQLIACFVAETPRSAEVKTRYCKPVR